MPDSSFRNISCRDWAGRPCPRENALESARVLSAVNPTFIRIRSTVPVPGTPLYDMMPDRWEPLTEEEKVREMRLFIESLSGITSTVQSDHIMNLLEDVSGELPRDRERMLAVIDRFLEMGADDRECFIVGRRIGRYRLLADYVPMPDVETIKQELKERLAPWKKACSKFWPILFEIILNFPVFALDIYGKSVFFMSAADRDMKIKSTIDEFNRHPDN